MKNRLANTLYQLIIAAFLLAQTAHAGEIYDLVSLYATTKAKDPAIGRAAARLESGRADYDIALAGLLPKIEASASEKKFWIHVENSNTPGTIDGTYNGYSYAIGSRLMLFSLPAYYQLSAADAGIRSAESFNNLARQDLMTRLVAAYVAFVKAQKDEKVYSDEKSRLTRILEQAEAYLKAGTGDIIAVHEARARLDGAGADLVKAQGARRLAEQALMNLTGVNVTAVKDIAITTPSLPEPTDLNWWIETMQQRNPSIRQALEDLTQAEEGTKAAQAGHWPSVNLYGGYTTDKGSTFLPELINSQWYVSANLTVPIYSGGDTSARTRKALAGESERRFMLTDARDQRLQRLKEAFVKVQYSMVLAEAYQRKLASVETQLKAVQKGLSLGTRTTIDLLNAEQSHAVSQRDLASALYDNFYNHIELKAAAGILEESDLAAIVYK